MMDLEEPFEWRLLSTVPWKGKGETPLRDPISGNFKITNVNNYIKVKIVTTHYNKYIWQDVQLL